MTGLINSRDHLGVVDEVGTREREWLLEQRYRAVLEVLDGAAVDDVAVRYGVSRQAVYTWKAKHAAGGFEGLREVSRRLRTSPTRLPAQVEALACEMRRAHPRWGARRIAFEIAQAGVPAPPSRSTVHRVLVRNGLVRRQTQQHRRKYRRWQREAPMHLWQLDLVGGVFLADGRECKMLTGIDDHSRYIVVAAVLAVPSGRAVADAFLKAMRIHGVPAEVLTDNGKQFTGRFTRPRPAEVLFERVCRENGITAKLTKPYSPTTTGKIERWHRTLRRELLDEADPFVSLPAAQAAITAWVQAYKFQRPHQSLGMATPASLFRPNSPPEPLVIGTAPIDEHEALPPQHASPSNAPTKPGAAGLVGAVTTGDGGGLVMPSSAGAVEFDTVIAASGLLSVIPAVQRIRMGSARAGQRAHLWVDEFSVHIFIDGQLVKTVPSNLNAEDLVDLRMRGGQPAGPPPATPSTRHTEKLPAGTVIEAERTVDANGTIGLAAHRLKVGTELAGQRIIVRLDGHLVHVIHQAVLAKTLASPIPATQHRTIIGARVATAELPAPAPGPISAQRKVPADGIVMVARERLRVGRTYAGKIVTIHVEDTHFRITCDGAELAIHPRRTQHPVRRWKPKIHAPKN